MVQWLIHRYTAASKACLRRRWFSATIWIFSGYNKSKRGCCLKKPSHESMSHVGKINEVTKKIRVYKTYVLETAFKRLFSKKGFVDGVSGQEL
jgi:hypothetical protein